MSGRDSLDVAAMSALRAPVGGQAIGLSGMVRGSPAAGVQVTTLVALAGGGTEAFVLNPNDPKGPALRGRTMVDLRSDHIGRSVVVFFGNSSEARTIVLGVLRGYDEERSAGIDQSVELLVGADELVVEAKESIVLRCGKASITLTSAGKVLIEGTFVASRSTGLNRITGGTVSLN